MSQLINRLMRPSLGKCMKMRPMSIKSSFSQSIRPFASFNDSFDASKNRTFVVGIDGTSYGYYALQHAFALARSDDTVIALHIPLDLYQFAYEQLVFSAGVSITQEQKDTFHKKREEFINAIEKKVTDLNKKCNLDGSNGVNFKFMVDDDSVAIKYDLVDAADELKCDYLVLGAKGHTHSIKEAVEKRVIDMLGSVPDYCIHNANCSVIVVKPDD